jgi:hypothetical protein
MGIYELREMGYEEQVLFAKEYLPAVYEKLADMGETIFIEKDPNDLSPIMPSFDDNDDMYFTKDGRRHDNDRHC